MVAKKKPYVKRGSRVIGGPLNPVPKAQVLVFDVSVSNKRKYVGLCTVYADPKEVFETMFATLANEFGRKK